MGASTACIIHGRGLLGEAGRGREGGSEGRGGEEKESLEKEGVRRGRNRERQGGEEGRSANNWKRNGEKSWGRGDGRA